MKTWVQEEEEEEDAFVGREREKERSYSHHRTEGGGFKCWNYERENLRVGSDDACRRRGRKVERHRAPEEGSSTYVTGEALKWSGRKEQTGRGPVKKEILD